MRARDKLETRAILSDVGALYDKLERLRRFADQTPEEAAAIEGVLRRFGSLACETERRLRPLCRPGSARP